MIKNINMSMCATYGNEVQSLSECKKINFVYGPNGSGKSTISDFLSKNHENRYLNCSCEWSTLDRQNIMVYNRDFREKNFHSSNDILGVFTLGESTIDEEEKIEQLKNKRDELNINISKTSLSIEKEQEKKKNAIEQFRNSIWEALLKKYEEFTDAFSGYRNNKEKFCQEVLARYEKNNNETFVYDDLLKRSEQIFSNSLDYVSLIEIKIYEYLNEINKIENDDIWEMVIVGNKDISISEIIEELGNADWVNVGRKYIKENGVCPFCQQKTIDKSFVSLLEKYFDEKYKSQLEQIKKYKLSYSGLIEKLITDIKKLLECQYVTDIGQLQDELIVSDLEKINRIVNDNKQKIDQKINEPGRKICFDSIKDIIVDINNKIELVNKKLKIHNDIVENIKFEKEKLSNDIWNYCIQQQKELIASFVKKDKNYDKAINGMKALQLEQKKQKTEIDEEIIEHSKKITSVEPTVNEINRLLKAYGFTGFSIAKSNSKENAYQIQRPDGTLAENTLSEGEETFISFLYFMQLTKGATDTKHISDHKIIVLDDPICSLDSTILYIVSTMVKNLIYDIRNNTSDVDQLFILTHNVFFHKEASFIDGRKNELSDVNFWIIRKEDNISKIISYGMKNPISTSYELLWEELKESKTSSLITIQNIMRRIIENYFGMLGTKKDIYLENKFDTNEERIICKSLLYWINDGSHSIPDDLFIDSYSGSVDKYQDVFMQIFDKTGNIAHYNMMMGKID